MACIPVNTVKSGIKKMHKVAVVSGPEKYFYISLAPWLVKLKSTSPIKFLTSPTNIY